MTHLALLVQWLYGECVSSYVNDHAQLEPICRVGRPYWLPVLHGLPPVNAATQLGKEKRQKEEKRQHEAYAWTEIDMQSTVHILHIYFKQTESAWMLLL